MAIILSIESSGDVCSAAISDDNKIVALKEVAEANIHSKILTVFIDDVLEKSKLTASDLDAVAVSKGPGSYTGLRIGVSAAKGIAYAKDIPLIAVDTQQSLAWGMLETIKKEGSLNNQTLLCPMTDARRMEVYSAFYDTELETIKPISADIIDQASYSEFTDKYRMIFFGSGAEKCRNIIGHPNAIFRDDIMPSARWIAHLAEEKFLKKDFEDLAYFEPFYLKNFVAKIPTKNVYGKF